MADTFRTEITAERSQYDAAMDGAAQKALTTSQAMASAFRASSIQMGSAVSASVKGMNTAFDSVKAAVMGVRGVLAAIAGSGLGLGKMINDTAQMTRETMLLAQAMGITTEEATTLRIALGDIEVKSEDYTAMMAKMVIKLRENEERFNELGIKTRGANGALLNTAEIMRNALSAMEAFKIGTDRNLASSEVFGRGWNEVHKLMRLTPEIMEQARQKTEELQLTIGPEGVARATAFKLAMHDVVDVGEALGNRVGQALMPVLTDLGNWLASMGPAAVLVMRGAVGGLTAAFNLFLTGVLITFKIAASTIYSIVEPIAAVAEAASLAVSGDFAGAAERLKQISKNVSANWKSSLDEIAVSAQKTAGQIAALFDPAAEQGQSPAVDKSGKDYEGDSRKGRMAKWEAELAAMRDAYDRMKLEQGSFEQFTKEKERGFWKAKLLVVREGSEEQSAVLKKFYDVEREIRKRAYEAGIADIKAQMDAAQTTAEQKINLAARVANMTAQHFGRESKEYKAALADMQKATDDWVKQQQRLRDLMLEHDRAFSLSRLELERENLDTLEKLGQIKTKDKLARLKELKDIEYQIELQALQQKLELLGQDPSTNPVLYQEQLEKIEELKRRHELQMTQLDNQMKIESVKIWNEIGDAITGAFSTAVKGVIMGTQSIGQAFRNMGQSVLLSLADMAVKAVAEAIKNAIIGRAVAKAKGVSEITSNAAVAASAAAASVAAIPVYGWALAPEVAATTFADTIAWTGALASAFSGFDVPVGVNPMTQLHQEEMVLPENIANPLRDAIAAGSLSGGDVYHINVKAWDGKSVIDSRRQIVAALRAAKRDFAYSGK
jgi:phenylpyruvate tautomerase PptA (4-oxalocrotonate tautomerase family)